MVRRAILRCTALGAAVALLGLVEMHGGRVAKPNLRLTAGTDFGITTTVSSSPTSSIPALLFPGVQRYLVYTVSNPMAVPMTVSALGIASVSAPPACPVAYLDVSATAFTGTLVVPPHGTNETTVPISLINAPVNQDGCQNVTFDFTYSGTAAYEVLPSVVAKPGATIIRVAGDDRILTSIAASLDSFGSGVAGSAVLARSDLYPDALAGTPLAVKQHAPMLLTAPNSLDPRTEAELLRVLPKGHTVYVLGGTVAIAPVVVRRLSQDGYPVIRLGEANRFSTAVAIARYLGTPNDILLGTGMNPPDALAGGAAAAKLGGAVLLTDGDVMPPETAAYLASEPAITRFALGGPAAKADLSATPVVGADRYETSVLVAERFFSQPAVVGFANGFAFPDALSGGTSIGERGGPLLLVAPDALPQTVHTYLNAISSTVTTAYVFGGTSVVPAAELAQIGVALDGR